MSKLLSGWIKIDGTEIYPGDLRHHEPGATIHGIDISVACPWEWLQGNTLPSVVISPKAKEIGATSAWYIQLLKHKFNNRNTALHWCLSHLSSKVSRLDLVHDVQIIDVDLEYLNGLTKLKELDLHDTQVTDAGLEHLKGLIRLKWLNLRGTQVSDAGLKHLNRLTRLEELYLSDTQVSDAGLEYLKGMTKLEHLTLANTQISDNGIKALHKVLPHCFIVLFNRRSS